MRPIKFRAWDGKKMVFVTELTWTKEPVMHLTGFVDGAMAWTQDGSLCRYRDDDVGEFGDFKLLQFTGLLDKNGKEIYEGDVVQEQFNPHLQIYEVKSQPSYFTAEDKEHRFPLHSIQYPLVVLGNIYENPELLTPSPKE